MNLRVHSLLPESSVNGPDHRSVVWLQGCSIGRTAPCKGCFNPDTWPAEGGKEMPTLAIVGWLGAHKATALTVSGGEPTDAPAALLEFVELVHVVYPWMSIGIFTGRTERELERIPEWPAIRAHLDFAAAGRFNRNALASDSPMVTSTNQRLLLFTNRYTPADFGPLSVEVTLDGLTQITTGFPIRGF